MSQANFRQFVYFKDHMILTIGSGEIEHIRIISYIAIYKKKSCIILQ